MTHFQNAVDWVINENEKGFVIDNGGPTNWGVTLSTLRRVSRIIGEEYPGFGDFDGDGDIDIDDIRVMTPEQAAIIYKNQWWDRYQYGRVDNFETARKIFDLAINMGPAASHIITQRAVNTLYEGRLVEDGLLGNNSFTHINKINPMHLLTEIKSNAWEYYKRILGKNKDLEINRNGWRNRAYK